MEYLNTFVDLQWVKENYFFILLTGVVALEWIMLQGLIIHTMLKREEAPKFTRERAQIIALEKLTNFQAMQIERLYGKLGELSREVSTQAGALSQKTSSKPSPSHERNMLTFGELSLKKRLTELAQMEKQKNTNTKPH